MKSKYLVIDNIYGKVMGGANTLAEAHEAADCLLVAEGKVNGDVTNVLVAEVIYSMHIHTSVVCEIRR